MGIITESYTLSPSCAGFKMSSPRLNLTAQLRGVGGVSSLRKRFPSMNDPRFCLCLLKHSAAASRRVKTIQSEHLRSSRTLQEVCRRRYNLRKTALELCWLLGWQQALLRPTGPHSPHDCGGPNAPHCISDS